jgi:N-acetylneuraminic acid mutarotase
MLTGYGGYEIYDPASATWEAGDDDNRPFRYGHFSVRLEDGRVLVAGGRHSKTAELYDPVADTWTYTGALDSPRIDATATLLESGRVLVVGGEDADEIPLSSAMLYDPDTGSWLRVGSMAEGRLSHAAALLADGTVLLAGGLSRAPDDSYIASDTVERYAPQGSITRRPGRRVPAQ